MRLLHVYLGWTLLSLASWPLVCLTPFVISRTLSARSSLTTIPIPYFLSSAPVQNSLHPPAMFLALLPFRFVSCRHNMTTFLCSIISASSLPLPVIVPILKVPTYMSERLLFHTSRCFFTRLPPLFLLLFSLCLAVA